MLERCVPCGEVSRDEALGECLGEGFDEVVRVADVSGTSELAEDVRAWFGSWLVRGE